MEQLIIFARAPRAGEVKTRIAAETSPAVALDIYQRLLATLFGNLKALRGVQVACAPADATGELQPLVPPGWVVVPQKGGDLGERLRGSFADAFGNGATKVIIIGSDCPEVRPRHIREAFAALNKVDAVFGPATDGGYWLVGLRASQPNLFEEIPWSTPDVLARTLAAAKERGLKIDLLEILPDVDTRADWEAYQKRQKQT